MMSAAIQIAPPDLRDELNNWRERLEASTKDSADTLQLNGLLREVKAAIERLGQADSYGVCQVCHDLIGQGSNECGSAGAKLSAMPHAGTTGGAATGSGSRLAGARRSAPKAGLEVQRLGSFLSL